MFYIFDNIKSWKGQVCTPELFWKACDSKLTGEVCAEIADAREKMLRGEMS